MSQGAVRLAIGTAQFGLPYGVAGNGQVTASEGAAILRAAWAEGVRTLDTAAVYGDSEARLGTLGVRGWEVVTKLPEMPENCSDVDKWVDRSVASSLERLQVTEVHGLLLHRPMQLLGPQGRDLYRALMRQTELGRVRRVGASVYEPAELEVLFERYPLQIIQAPLNLVDRRLVESGWADRLNGLGVELHVRSVFLQGLLLMDSARRPRWARRWDQLWSALDAWIDDHRVSPLRACLGYVLGFPQVARVVVGVDGLAQLQQIIESVSQEQNGARPKPTSWHATDPDLLNPATWPRLEAEDRERGS